MLGAEGRQGSSEELAEWVSKGSGSLRECWLGKGMMHKEEALGAEGRQCSAVELAVWVCKGSGSRRERRQGQGREQEEWWRGCWTWREEHGVS